MKLLSDKLYKDLKVNDIVISRRGSIGVIDSLFECFHRDGLQSVVSVTWLYEKNTIEKSIIFHPEECDNINWIGSKGKVKIPVQPLINRLLRFKRLV